MDTRSRYEATRCWGSSKSYRWAGAIRLGYSRLQNASKRPVTLWENTTDLKNTGDAFSELRLSYSHLTNSTSWVSMSKSWHLTLWDQDLWSVRWAFFGHVSRYFPSRLHPWINDLILFWITLKDGYASVGGGVTGGAKGTMKYKMSEYMIGAFMPARRLGGVNDEEEAIARGVSCFNPNPWDCEFNGSISYLWTVLQKRKLKPGI